MQRLKGGLFVDLNSFVAFGEEYVKIANLVNLNIQERPKQITENRPHKFSTLLEIGMGIVFT